MRSALIQYHHLELFGLICAAFIEPDLKAIGIALRHLKGKAIAPRRSIGPEQIEMLKTVLVG